MSLYYRSFLVLGGVTNDAVVSSPAAEDWQSVNFAPLEWVLIGMDDHWIRISVKNIEIPDERDENDLDVEQRNTLRGLIVSTLMFLTSSQFR